MFNTQPGSKVTGRFGRESFWPGVISVVSRFGLESFRPESIRPWVVSTKSGESFRLDFYSILYTLHKMFMLLEASLPCS